jgi:hypothetical protein
MSDRSLSQASWVAFFGFFGLFYLISSCSGDSSTEERPASVPVETITEDATDSTAVDDASTTEATPIAFVPPEGDPDLLSEWNQLDVRNGRLVTLDGVTPYTLNSALFTDDAHKLRTVWLPDGSAAAMADPDETFDFPVGTVITKTFYYTRGGRGGRCFTHRSRRQRSQRYPRAQRRPPHRDASARPSR